MDDDFGFDPGDFSSQFIDDGFVLDDDADAEDAVIGQSGNGNIATTDYGSGGEVIEIVRGSYPTDPSIDDRSGPGQGAAASRSQRTDESDDSREREQLTESRRHTDQIYGRSAKFDGRSDEQRRIDEQNKKSVAEAIRRLQASDTEPRTDANTSDGGLQPDTRILATTDITPNNSKTFSGCEFEATLYRMHLTANGEWIIQFRASYSDRLSARRMDETTGLALKVRVEQV